MTYYRYSIKVQDPAPEHRHGEDVGDVFHFSLLVSAMNFYAVIREPDLIDIDEIHEYPARL